MQPQPGGSRTQVAPPILTIDGPTLLNAFTHATRVIGDHREQLNALNVFPVPDGDTGTNMAMTMRTALDTIRRLVPGDDLPAGLVAERFAYGSLMGARGNSGVILSQILRGFASEIEHLHVLDGPAIAAALTNAGRVAYQAVVRPVEGTMLTVISDAARAANTTLASSASAASVLLAAADAAAESLSLTPESLAVLRQAQVVDAGGQGVAYLLRALANSITGNLDAIQIGDDHPVPSLANINVVEDDLHGGATGYCTNFIVAGSHVDLYQFRERLNGLGTSTVIVGDRDFFKVHIHTDRPDHVLTMALEFGSLDRIAIENMERQASEVAANLSGQTPAATSTAPLLIAHTDGPGIAEVLLTMGAATVVSSEQDFAAEIAAHPDRPVILLPGSAQALATANQLPGEMDRTIHVVQSISPAQIVTALGAINPDEDAAKMTTTMNMAASRTEFAEITSSSDVASSIESGLASMNLDDPDIVTIFTGKDAAPEEIAVVQNVLSTLLPGAEIETLSGDQTSSRYIIWFE